MSGPARSARRARPARRPRVAEQALPADGDDGLGRDDTWPRRRRSSPATGTSDQPGGARSHDSGSDRGSSGTPDPDRGLDPALGRLHVVEDRAVGSSTTSDVDAGRRAAASSSLAVARLVVDADDRGRRQPEPGGRQGRVRDAAAEPPAARIVLGDVARGRRPTWTHLDRGAGASAPSGTLAVRILRPRQPSATRQPCSSTSSTRATTRSTRTSSSSANPRWSPTSSSSSSSRIRHQIQDTYEHDTLIEAIAVELERDHGFIFVSDDRLVGGGQRLDRGGARTSSPTSTSDRRRRGRRR